MESTKAGNEGPSEKEMCFVTLRRTCTQKEIAMMTQVHDQLTAQLRAANNNSNNNKKGAANKNNNNNKKGGGGAKRKQKNKRRRGEGGNAVQDNDDEEKREGEGEGEEEGEGGGTGSDRLDGIKAQLEAMATDDKIQQIDFPATLSSKQRAIVHQIAGELGFEHSSAGWGDRRHLMVKKPFNAAILISPAGVLEEMLYYCGYIGLSSALVSAVARRDMLEQFKVPKSRIDTRIKRDGNENHITLITRREIEDMWASSGLPFGAYIDQLLARLQQEIKSDWEDLGLGHIATFTQGKESMPDNEAFFRVIRWPSAAAWRKGLGLEPKDFHVTVGFAKADIHHLPKGPDTLLKEN